MSNEKQQERICPIFTAALLMGQAMRPRPEAPRVLPTAGLPQPLQVPEQEAAPCAGAMCMWWQPVSDAATGKVLGGECTVPMATKQLFELGRSVANLVQLGVPGIIPNKH